MADYSHLKKLDVNSETLAEYVFSDIPGDPSIWFAPATDANKDFLSARLRLSVERAEKAEKEPRNRRRGLTADAIEEDREADRRLISETCAKRWGEAPLDAQGKAQPFSAAECYDFFKAMPDYIFDPVRGFCANIYNFVPRVAVVTEDQADAVGNA